MSSNNNNEKVQNNSKKNSETGFRNDFFDLGLGIKDDIFDPFNNDFMGIDSLENTMFRNFRNIFSSFDDEKCTEKPKEVKAEEEKEEEINTNIKNEEEKEEEKEEEINTNSKMEEEKEEEKVEEINTDSKMEEENEEEINTDSKKEEIKPVEENKENIKNNGTIFSRVYTSSYKNINGKEESYTSNSIRQTNNGHNITETKEAYKNSDGVCKSAYQRGLDDKTARFIKEKNLKTGKHNQKKVMKGIEENEINDFNKSYNDYCKKCGFRKNFNDLSSFDPFGINKKYILPDRTSNLLLHRLLF